MVALTFHKQFFGRFPLIFFLNFPFFPFSVYSQSLFESSLSESISSQEAKYRLNGYFRGGLFVDDKSIMEKYAEGALKLDITGNQYGDAYAEMRYRASGTNNEANEFWLREGYINLYLGKFDFRIGQQVIVWGRADGFNPTNNLTPADFTVYSPDEDDRRLANFVAKGTYNFQPFKLEVDWVPFYKATELPLERSSLPDGVSWGESRVPESEWNEGSFAAKLDIQKAKIDGSFSYFNGYHKMSGLGYSISTSGIEVFTQAYRVQVVGADFSTTTNSYGLRGEFAFTLPDKESDSLFSTPCKQLEYTLGIDREWGNFSLIAQYVGKYVFDFAENIALQNTLAIEVNRWNRMLFSQTSKWNHSVSLRPSISFFYETLKCEVLGLANFSTEEWLAIPKITYNISDALSFCVGAQLSGGPDNTLYGFMGDIRNTGFAELKISF